MQRLPRQAADNSDNSSEACCGRTRRRNCTSWRCRPDSQSCKGRWESRLIAPPNGSILCCDVKAGLSRLFVGPRPIWRNVGRWPRRWWRSHPTLRGRLPAKSTTMRYCMGTWSKAVAAMCRERRGWRHPPASPCLYGAPNPTRMRSTSHLLSRNTVNRRSSTNPPAPRQRHATLGSLRTMAARFARSTQSTPLSWSKSRCPIGLTRRCGACRVRER
mmetsp:Transcript_6165/g.15228  ORF Transcript_6165/g.15228 Transcript_6165/m.15228 type:complete len:216 (+) Transcript_6165:119-766(+)